MTSSYHGWLDKLMLRVCACCYQSLTCRQWFRDRAQIIAALTTPAAMAKNFNWDVQPADVEMVATRAVEQLERYQAEAIKQKQTIKYAPAFLRMVAEREVKLASDNWKQATAKPGGLYDGIAKGIKVSDVDVLASLHQQISTEASKVKKDMEPKRPSKPKFKAEQFEMSFA